jgi:DNA-binding CsgD family transcriptional regulator
MATHLLDATQLQRVGVRLGDTIIDPAIWPEVMEEVSAAVGATGAALLQSDVRTSDIPRTSAVRELFDSYFAEGWHTRDLRATRGVPRLLRGEMVITDQDLVNPDDIGRSDFYNECLRPHGFQWFAAVGFWAGPHLWGLSIQRTINDGPFEAADKRILAELSHRLTETATLSTAIGRAVLTGMTNALNLVDQPAIVLNRLGIVLETNAAAECIFDDELRIERRRLLARDKTANAALERLADSLRVTSDGAALSAAPIVVRSYRRPPVIIRILPIDGAARGLFLGARVLLILSDTGKKVVPKAHLLASAFGLSAAETRIAGRIGSGVPLEKASEMLGISRETARNQLMAVFAKVSFSRQPRAWRSFTKRRRCLT